MEKIREFHVRSNCAGITLYHFLRRVLPKSHSVDLTKIIEDGAVQVNDSASEPEARLKKGDYVTVIERAMRDAKVKPKFEALDVLFRDEAVICVLKPAGMSVIPDRRQVGKTAVQVCRQMLEGEKDHPRPVHRLDKWTSGVLVMALKKKYVEPMGKLFAERKVDKTYLAFVRGRPMESEGVIDEAIGPNARRMTRIIVGGKLAKPARTRYRTLCEWQGFSLLEVKIETGRTHQIRVHLSHIGHPILCDSLYGGGDALYLSELKLDYKLGRGKREKPLLSRQALHAGRIRFESPATGKAVEVEAPLPHDLEVVRKKLDRYAEPSS
jgi:RluA family pseudouridine synthase